MRIVCSGSYKERETLIPPCRVISMSLFVPLLEFNQHLAAVRLLFDSLMMRGVVEYNPAARARPPRLVRESSQTPVFEEAELVAFLDSIGLDSLKDIRDKAIFCVLFYSWCRVSALINLGVSDYYERGGTRWLRFEEKRGKKHEVPVHSKAKEAVDLGLTTPSVPSEPFIDVCLARLPKGETNPLSARFCTVANNLGDSVAFNLESDTTGR